jgi:predicted dinucleotide-binding enzyme
MKVGVLGTGDVGKALGKGFIALGHEVKMGSRSAQNEKALAWAKEMGPKTSTSTFADAASFGEVVVLATLGVANECMLWVLSAIRGGNWNQAFKLLRK